MLNMGYLTMDMDYVRGIEADKGRYTIELYNRAKKAEEKADYWECEAKKWCSKLGEIRLWIGE